MIISENMYADDFDEKEQYRSVGSSERNNMWNTTTLFQHYQSLSLQPPQPQTNLGN
jgi:hypothetical protein